MELSAKEQEGYGKLLLDNAKKKVEVQNIGNTDIKNIEKVTEAVGAVKEGTSTKVGK